MKMKKKCCGLSRDAFSLVEVIIAIAVLAVLIIPTLAYFSNASVFTSKGKESQRAEVAGQTALEELQKYGTFEEIEALDGVNDWTVEATAPPGSTGGETLLTKEIQDGEEYQAKIKVDYDSYKATADRYNDYKVPDIKQVYSEETAVFPETDQTDVGVMEIYGKIENSLPDDVDMTLTTDDIKDDVTRTLYLEASEIPGKTLINIKAYYKYRYTLASTGTTYESEVAIKTVQRERDSLERIYVFYKALRNAPYEEEIDVNIPITVLTTAQASKLNIFFVVQKPKPASGYTLDITAHDAALQASYLSNFQKSTLTSVSVNPELVKTETQRRIAKISADVYDLGETTFNESTLRAHVELTKGE